MLYCNVLQCSVLCCRCNILYSPVLTLSLTLSPSLSHSLTFTHSLSLSLTRLLTLYLYLSLTHSFSLILVAAKHSPSSAFSSEDRDHDDDDDDNDGTHRPCSSDNDHSMPGGDTRKEDANKDRDRDPELGHENSPCVSSEVRSDNHGTHLLDTHWIGNSGMGIPAVPASLSCKTHRRPVWLVDHDSIHCLHALTVTAAPLATDALTVTAAPLATDALTVTAAPLATDARTNDCSYSTFLNGSLQSARNLFLCLAADIAHLSSLPPPSSAPSPSPTRGLGGVQLELAAIVKATVLLQYVASRSNTVPNVTLPLTLSLT